jgi:pimeloyl-ACP methyl ester carboxylesterase
MTGPRDHRTGAIHWRERPGTGAVLVCLHGIGSNAASFDALLPHLPADWRVIAWNAPGYGGSAPLPGDWPVAADYAAALAGFADALALPRFRLLGHSLGTLIAAAFALRHPGRVTRLTLAACAQGYGTAPGGALPAGVQARIDDLDRLGPAAFAAARAARLVHDAAAHPALVARIEAAMAAVRQPGYGQAARMLGSGDLAADAAGLAVPTDVIVGAGDVVTPPDQSRRAHDALPAAVRGRFTLVPGAGHAVYQQAPAAVAAAICAEREERIDAD